MIVVADTSVILNLSFLGQEGLLPLLFGTIYAPPKVEAEFQGLVGSDLRFQGLVFPDFIQRTDPPATTHAWARSPLLHGGEIEALSLALELRADLVLMDEAEGRATAKSLSLATMGLLGVPLMARQRSLIGSLAPLLDRLDREARFWMAPALRAAILRASGELP